MDGSTAVYADRTIGDIPGRIVEVGELDDAVNLSGSSGSQSLAVTLDDTDGSIKAILDSQDVHKRPAPSINTSPACALGQVSSL